MEKLIENCGAFRKLHFGENTDMLPYDDNVKKANWETLKDECKMNAIKKVFTKIYADKILQEIQDNQFSDKEILSVYHEYRLKNSNKLGNVLWITFNPAPNINFEDFKSQCDKFVNKKWVFECIWVIEQRGKTLDELGNGFHAHFLIWRQPDKRPNQIVSETKTHFKNYCDVEKWQCLNIQNCKEDHIDNRKNYMLGEKKLQENDDKYLKQMMDIKWRELIKEPTHYCKNIKV